MKKGEQPELTLKWWKASQPKGLKSAGRLEDALKAFEAARKTPDAALHALDDVETSAKAVVAEAGRAKGAPEMEWTADCLKKLDRVVAAERKELSEAAGGDEKDGEFANPDAYHKYLSDSLKRIRGAGQMNFAVLFGRKPADHRLALHKSKAGRTLGARVMQETGLHTMTFGVAMTPKAAGLAAEEEAEAAEPGQEVAIAEDKPRALVLSLEGKQLPGMQVKLTKMLRAFGPLPFNAITLMVDGAMVEDIADTEGDEAEAGAPAGAGPQAEALHASMDKLAPALKAAMASAPGQRSAMMAAAAAFVAAMKTNDLAGAEAALKQVAGLVAAARGGGGDWPKARTAWQQASDAVDAQIAELQVALRGSGHAGLQKVADFGLNGVTGGFKVKMMAAMREVDAANASPAALGKLAPIVDGFLAHVQTDQRVAACDENPVGVKMTLRSTLGGALTELQRVAAAA